MNKDDDFGKFYNQFRFPVLRYIDKRVDNHETAQDLTQKTFIRFLTSENSKGAPLNRLIFTIARNLVFNDRRDTMRRERRQTRIDGVIGRDESGLKIEATADPDGVDPEKQVIKKETTVELLESMQGLYPRQRQAIGLRYWEGLTNEQTAEVMKTTSGAVKSLIHHGLKRLRKDIDRF